MARVRNLGGAALTEQVRRSFDACPDPRLRAVMEALVTHLHAFASEVRLTEDEWFRAVDFLTRAGQTCDDQRQELVLLSDVLGLSMLVVGLNHDGEGAPADGGPAATAPTESTVFGPFFVEGAPAVPDGGDLAAGASGTPCLVEGRVLSTDGAPVAGATVDVWQADDEGLYDVQRPDLAAAQGRGRLTSRADGGFRFWTVRPEPYPIPTDGPVGELLGATRRGPMRPAHIHFMVAAEGYERLITHVFVEGDPYLDRDAVFGVRDSLIAPFVEHPAGATPDGSRCATPFTTVAYDLVVRPVGAGT